MALVFSHILLPMNNAIGTGFEKCWNSVVVMVLSKLFTLNIE